MKIQEFNPTKAELKSAIMECEGLKIKGIDDEKGYEAVKSAKKRLAEYRITISKFGKEQRTEAIKWQKEVLRQEHELLAIIEPVESRLKEEMENVDKAKAMEERKVLLPSRINMLNEIGIKLLDTEILSMDEKEFSAYYTEQKMNYDEKIRIEKERIEREKQIEKEKEEAVKKAKEQAIIDERNRVALKKKREKERLEQEAKEKEAEKKKIESNKKFKEWKENNGMTEENKDNFMITKKDSCVDGKIKFTLYKKIDEIIL